MLDGDRVGARVLNNIQYPGYNIVLLCVSTHTHHLTPSTSCLDMRDDKDNRLEKKQLMATRDKVTSFLLVDVISDKDDFHCH